MIRPRAHVLHLIEWVDGTKFSATKERSWGRGEDTTVSHRYEGAGSESFDHGAGLSGGERIPSGIDSLGQEYPRRSAG